MPTKFGRGLNREIVSAVNRKAMSEPFSRQDVKRFSIAMGWDVTESYLDVSLNNASPNTHSPNYKKYFVALGNGKYKLNDSFRGRQWI